MTFGRTIRRTKSVILTVLVLLSIFLSYILWLGNWQNTTEVGFTATNTLPPADSPRVTEATAPYRVVLMDNKPNRYSVAVQGSELYQNWLTQLNQLHIYGFHTVSSLPLHPQFEVEYDFGADLDRGTLLNWVPNLTVTAIPVHGDSVMLFQTAPKGTVNIGIESDGLNYVGQTDLSPEQTRKSIIDATRRVPWLAWNQSIGSYIPGAGEKMQMSTWSTSTDSVLPIVHSFFVNPQVLTRIQENPSTILWTDGSRAVQWIQNPQLITFEDPNFTSQSVYSEAGISDVMNFIRNHGGGPDNLIAFTDQSPVNAGEASTYTFIPFINGYPVVDSHLNYQVEVYQGHILQYARPLLRLSKQISSTAESTLSTPVLTGILRRLTGTSSLDGIDLRVGYQPIYSGSKVTFQPAYFAYQNGTLHWVINAFTGDVLSGGGQS